MGTKRSHQKSVLSILKGGNDYEKHSEKIAGSGKGIKRQVH
jgi:hypothetical protein